MADDFWEKVGNDFSDGFTSFRESAARLAISWYEALLNFIPDAIDVVAQNVVAIAIGSAICIGSIVLVGIVRKVARKIRDRRHPQTISSETVEDQDIIFGSQERRPES